MTLDQLIETLRSFEAQQITGPKPGSWARAIAAIETLREERDDWRRAAVNLFRAGWEADDDDAEVIAHLAQLYEITSTPTEARGRP